jgi:hypothetical protein
LRHINCQKQRKVPMFYPEFFFPSNRCFFH